MKMHLWQISKKKVLGQSTLPIEKVNMVFEND